MINNPSYFRDVPDRRPTCCERLMKKVGGLSDYVSSTFCNCVASVPTLVLVLMALILVMLLIASFPLLFAYSYMTAEGSSADVPKISISPIRSFNAPHLPRNVSSCKGYG